MARVAALLVRLLRRTRRGSHLLSPPEFPRAPSAGEIGGRNSAPEAAAQAPQEEARPGEPTPRRTRGVPLRLRSLPRRRAAPRLARLSLARLAAALGRCSPAFVGPPGIP
ncbi:uncharacterized protein B0T15DRAFT_496393 [Chaetomium strumarium]|uniref:Uncharacterized protein n=1 Tax=Chaetomium strumarium TaxID=1170767 RepID=A0AAJ0LY39_9PEZI|nr:hypothetical protein B0T15DRAFT_496393 [Chaetomium strumarium]